MQHQPAAAHQLIAIITHILSIIPTVQEDLQHEQEKRAADRQGRIKAEQALKQLRLQLALQPQQQATEVSGQITAASQQDDARQQPMQDKPSSNKATAALPTFPFTAIGTLKSCFTNRLLQLMIAFCTAYFSSQHGSSWQCTILCQLHAAQCGSRSPQ